VFRRPSAARRGAFRPCSTPGLPSFCSIGLRSMASGRRPTTRCALPLPQPSATGRAAAERVSEPDGAARFPSPPAAPTAAVRRCGTGARRATGAWNGRTGSEARFLHVGRPQRDRGPVAAFGGAASVSKLGSGLRSVLGTVPRSERGRGSESGAGARSERVESRGYGRERASGVAVASRRRGRRVDGGRCGGVARRVERVERGRAPSLGDRPAPACTPPAARHGRRHRHP
jgi:hypothetical protein